MSDDTLNVDSGEELPTDQQVETDDSASLETTDDSNGDATEPKGKEKALKDTEAALKERQAEFTRLSQQLAEMKGQLTTLTQLQTQQAKHEEVKDWMEELNSDNVVEDPLSAMKMVVNNLRKEIASVLSDRDAFLLSKVNSTSGLDPEIKAKVDELRNDPDFADLPDKSILAMAKKLAVPKKAVMQPRGSISAGSRGAPSRQVKEGEYTPEQLAWLRASGAIKSNQRDDTLE